MCKMQMGRECIIAGGGDADGVWSGDVADGDDWDAGAVEGGRGWIRCTQMRYGCRWRRGRRWRLEWRWRRLRIMKETRIGMQMQQAVDEEMWMWMKKMVIMEMQKPLSRGCTGN